MMDDSIAAPGLAHRAMAPELELIADLMGGTGAMRRAGQRWLPREANESWSAWRARLHRSVLFNGLARTVQALAGRPFARPVTLADAAPLAALAASTMRRNGDGDFAAIRLRARRPMARPSWSTAARARSLRAGAGGAVDRGSAR